MLMKSKQKKNKNNVRWKINYNIHKKEIANASYIFTKRQQ